jgi:hypothetical protein
MNMSKILRHYKVSPYEDKWVVDLSPWISLFVVLSKDVDVLSEEAINSCGCYGGS